MNKKNQFLNYYITMNENRVKKKFDDIIISNIIQQKIQ